MCEFLDLPPRIETICVKYVYKLKYNSDENIKKYKII